MTTLELLVWISLGVGIVNTIFIIMHHENSKKHVRGRNAFGETVEEMSIRQHAKVLEESEKWRG